VRVSGATRLVAEDVDSVAGVTRDADDEASYVVEFYDCRNAERYKTEEQSDEDCKQGVPSLSGIEPPPGLDLEPPPGLVQPQAGNLSPPPGLKDTTSSAASTVDPDRSPSQVEDRWVLQGYRVRVHGLPNTMLAEEMMDAVLQQAGLESAVVGYTTTRGEGFGEAVVSISNLGMALHCVHHFQGCRWGSSRPSVTAEILMPTEDDCGSSQLFEDSCGLPGDDAYKAVKDAAAMAICKSALSAEAPVFVPGPAATSGFTHWSLSATAPAFAHGILSADAPAFIPASARKPGRSPAACSETSTNISESGSEDEKEFARQRPPAGQ